MFDLLTATIAAVCVLVPALALHHTRDVFHPAVLLAPMALFMYVFYPLLLMDTGSLERWFTAPQLEYVQTLNLATVTALLVGCVAGGRQTVRASSSSGLAADPHDTATALRRLGITFGLVSLLTWFYNLGNVGGFEAAYSVVKGGGTAESGYLRDFFMLGIPAIALLLEARVRGRTETWTALLLLAVVLAFLSHGLLATRRGPTFNIMLALIFSWYLVQQRRPSLGLVTVGGFLGGTLLLFLVTFRGHIYLGSDFFSSQRFERVDVSEAIRDQLVGSEHANEYVYGTSAILRARGLDRFYYGRRYLAVALVRPIPSQLWPTKYEDVGMSEMLLNSGVLIGTQRTLAPNLLGAAPGFVADLYVEFAWGCLVAAFAVGWLFGHAWRIAITRRGIWTAVYVSLAAMSVHLVTQTGVQFIYKTLLVLVPTALGWWFFARFAQQPQQRREPSPLERRRYDG